MAVVPDARPQDADRGQIEFVLNCARCHGTDAKGSGPDSAKLDPKPVDLTVLAKHNHGRFDAGAVYQMIDGRNARLSHHRAEMPIWGCRHQPAVPSLPATTKRKQKIPKRILLHREVVWVLLAQLSIGWLLLVLSLWACGQRACVVQHVHSDAMPSHG